VANCGRNGIRKSTTVQAKQTRSINRDRDRVGDGRDTKLRESTTVVISRYGIYRNEEARPDRCLLSFENLSVQPWAYCIACHRLARPSFLYTANQLHTSCQATKHD
jgi:hypothetical protein